MNAVNLLIRILSALLALVLFVGGLLAAAEIVTALFGGGPLLVPHETWSSWLKDHTWEDPVVLAGLAVLVLVGLVLLFVALKRGRSREIALPGTTGGVSVTADRRGVEKAVAAAARRTDGITEASASAGKRTVHVAARTQRRSEGDLDQRVRAAVTGRLEDLGLGRLRPRVKVTRKDGR